MKVRLVIFQQYKLVIYKKYLYIYFHIYENSSLVSVELRMSKTVIIVGIIVALIGFGIMSGLLVLLMDLNPESRTGTYTGIHLIIWIIAGGCIGIAGSVMTIYGIRM